MSDWKQRFYQSKAWRSVRGAVLARDRYVCGLCGEVIAESPEVHHTLVLTEQNYRDPDISLNPARLETLHHACHDARHGRFGEGKKESLVDEYLEIDYARR